MAQAALVDKCDLCESEDNVEYFCVTCDEILCNSCKVLHSKSKSSRNDTIITLSQARRDNIVHKSTPVFCVTHHLVEVTLFCLQCSELVCPQCLAGDHKRHHVTIPDEVKDSKAEELSKIITELKEKKAAYENAFDVQSQTHGRFLKSLDNVEKEISKQKAKIIEELTVVCDEQFAELKTMRQNEEKKYADACNEIQAQNKVVTSALQTAESSIESNNPTSIIQATVHATQTLNELKDPNMPQEMIAAFQPGNRSPQNITKVQGKVYIHQGAKLKPMTDVHNVHLQKQKIKHDIKQQQTQVRKTKIDVKKVKIKSTLKVKDFGFADVIVPLENKTAWIKSGISSQFFLINSEGKLISKSIPLDHGICDAKKYANELLVTCYNDCRIYKMSEDGKSTSAFADMSPYEPRGLCVTEDLGLMVCLESTKDNQSSKVVRLNRYGKVIETIQYDVTGIPLYNDPWFVTLLTSGEVIVTCSKPRCRITGVDKERQHLFTWEGEIQGRKMDNYCVEHITHDSNNNLFVSDIINNKVYVLGKDGSGMISLLDNIPETDSTSGIAIDHKGNLWVGCKDGNIYIIEY